MAKGDIVRRLSLQVSVDGTRQADRGLQRTADGVGQVGSASADASKKVSGLADSLLKGSDAADKKLKSLEKVFAGSDRVASIIGKVTAALGIGALAFKGATLVAGLFNDKQKQIAKTAKQVEANFRSATRQMKLYGAAQAAAMKAIGDDFTNLDPTARSQAIRLQKKLAEETSARAAAESRLAALDDNFVELNAQLMKLGVDKAKLIRERENFREAVAAKLEARLAGTTAALSMKQDILTKLRDEEAKAVKRHTKAQKQLTEAIKKHKKGLNLTDPNTPKKKPPGGIRSAPTLERPSAIVRLIDRALISSAERFERKLLDLFSQLRNPLPMLDATPERATKALTTIKDAFSSFAPTASNASKALSPMLSQLQGIAVAFKGAAAEAKHMADFNGQLARFGSSAADGLLHAGVAAAFYGESISKALSQSVKSIGIEAVVQALKSTALGIGAVALGNPKAPLFFKQAATWGAVGAAAGVAGAALGGGGGGGGGVAPAQPSRRDLPRDNQRNHDNNITVVLDMKSRPFATQRDVEDAALRGATNALRRAGGGGAAFRRALGAA